MCACGVEKFKGQQCTSQRDAASCALVHKQGNCDVSGNGSVMCMHMRRVYLKRAPFTTHAPPEDACGSHHACELVRVCQAPHS